MTDPTHHKILRDRASRKQSASPLIKWFDRLLIVAGIMTVIMTIPQVLEIWLNKSADGVSTISWAYYVFYSVMFTIYGVIHKEFPIVFNYSTATVLYVLVPWGSVIY